MKNLKVASAAIFGMVLASLDFSTAAVPTVYKDIADWLNAVYEAGARVRAESFNDTPKDYELPAGTYNLDFFSITVDEAQPFQGFYGDFFTNRGQYFIGNINENNTFIELRPRLNIGGPPIGFGAEWVDTTTTSNLTMTVNGYLIEFSKYLTDFGILGNITGNGFLGFVFEDGREFAKVTLGIEDKTLPGEQFFMDNVLFAVSDKEDCKSFNYRR